MAEFLHTEFFRIHWKTSICDHDIPLPGVCVPDSLHSAFVSGRADGASCEHHGIDICNSCRGIRHPHEAYEGGERQTS